MMFGLAGLLACSGSTTSRDVTTGDTRATDTGTTLTETAETADTGYVWPAGLVGEPIDPPAPPMSFFVAENLEGEGRGPSHLYTGTPTLLTIMLGSPDDASEAAMDILFAGHTTLEAAGVNSVVVTWSSVASNSGLASSSGWTDVDMWSDPYREIYNHYKDEDASPAIPGSILLDADGYAVLEYDDIDKEDEHARDVAEDAALLWGAR